MPGPESIGGGSESREGVGERLGSRGGRAGCIRWAVEIAYDEGAEATDRATAAGIIREAIVASDDTSFDLECGGSCRAGCELVFPRTPGEPPEARSLVTDQGITSLAACEQH